jgi:DNA-binding CsgD family transcriptional regulator
MTMKHRIALESGMVDAISTLSDVQRQCLRLVGEGQSSKEIAGSLGLSYRTVDQYLHLAAQALGASNRRDAARLFKRLQHDEALNKLQLKPEPVAPPAKMDDLKVVAEPKSIPLNGLGLPPTGGSTNDLTTAGKLVAIGKIALFVTIVTMAIAIIAKGAFVVLS